MSEMDHMDVSEHIIKIANALKEKTAMPAYRLVIEKNRQPGIFDSKFGGVPYWNPARNYPVDAAGKKMMLLAQINFSAERLRDERLPDEGILQFFISSDDDLYGLDFDVPDSQRDFRVIYHETPDFSVTREQILALNLPACTEEEMKDGPVFRECAVKIEKTVAYMGTEVAGFDSLFGQLVKEQFDRNADGQSIDDLDESDYDYLDEQFPCEGHRILGYPYFTQGDPRESTDYYNTLLLQMDSDEIDGEYYVLWGDCGVANFFINSEALAHRDFSRVFYSWDCC
ncbi:MAG: YwqG family protein [Lachnospiraceae bacterium]